MKKERKPNNLHLLRILHGDLDQSYLAYVLEISQPAYSKLELGENKPSESVIKKLSDLYGFDIHEILYLDSNELKQRLLGKIDNIKPSLAEKVDMKLGKSKRKLKVIFNKMRIIS